jgi:hypothetical protein
LQNNGKRSEVLNLIDVSFVVSDLGRQQKEHDGTKTVHDVDVSDENEEHSSVGSCAIDALPNDLFLHLNASHIV